MIAAHESDWTASLALAEAGHRYRINRVLPSNVRDQCRRLGLTEGQEVTCLANARSRIDLMTAAGQKILLEREPAWFIRVDPPGVSLARDVARPVVRTWRVDHQAARFE